MRKEGLFPATDKRAAYLLFALVVLTAACGNLSQTAVNAMMMGIVADMGVNALEVNHERGNLKAPVGSCVVHLLVETRDAAHVQEMYEALRAQGYPIMER